MSYFIQKKPKIIKIDYDPYMISSLFILITLLLDTFMHTFSISATEAPVYSSNVPGTLMPVLGIPVCNILQHLGWLSQSFSNLLSLIIHILPYESATNCPLSHNKDFYFAFFPKWLSTSDIIQSFLIYYIYFLFSPLILLASFGIVWFVSVITDVHHRPWALPGT